MPRVTLAALNAAMKAEGIGATLYKGRGYFYFQDYAEGVYDVPSIYVYALSHCTFAEWLEQIRYAWKNRGEL